MDVCHWDFENRNKAEGFLILISTLVWIIATLRILLRGLRFRALALVPVGLRIASRDRKRLVRPFVEELASSTTFPSHRK